MTRVSSTIRLSAGKEAKMSRVDVGPCAGKRRRMRSKAILVFFVKFLCFPCEKEHDSHEDLAPMPGPP